MSISKNSTFEEAWEYMQSFRPTEAERAEWDDGTHNSQYPPPDFYDGGSEGSEVSGAGSSWGVKGKPVHLFWTRRAETEGEEGKSFFGDAHRDGGRPAILDFYSSYDNSRKNIASAKFLLAGSRRTGGEPWLIDFAPTGEVDGLRFSSPDGVQGITLLNESYLHRTDGPARVRLVGVNFLRIEITYAIHGEVIERVVIKKSAGAERA